MDRVGTQPHRTRRRLARAGCVLVSLIAVCASLGGCGKTGAGDGQNDQDAAETGVSTVSYTVRGTIREIPTPVNPGSEFRVRHEAMPHFRRQDGTLGMDTMVMPFPLRPGLTLEEFGVGDAITLVFEVDSDPQTGRFLAFRAVSVESLPDGVEPDFTPMIDPDDQATP